MKKYSYSSVKLFVSQMALSLFGLVLAIACAKISKAAQIVVSVGAVIFYLFLIYTAIWEVGSKDKFGIEYGKFEAKPLTGLYIGLLANSLNIVLAVFITLGLCLGNGGILSKIGGLCPCNRHLGYSILFRHPRQNFYEDHDPRKSRGSRDQKRKEKSKE